MKKKNVIQPKVIESSLTPVETTEFESQEEVIESDEVIEEVVVIEESKFEESKLEEVVIAPVSLKEAFAKHIETTPYVIYQNGLTVCRWKPNVRIELFDDTFELNGHHYKYSGVEIHHI